MSHDIVSDALNQMMNAKRSGKADVSLGYQSKLLLNVLAVGKLKGYIKGYKSHEGNLTVEFGKVNFCKAIKPRYMVKSVAIDKYVRRYLPGRGMGMIVVSTSQGLMTHQTAMDKKLGGSLIAYFY